MHDVDPPLHPGRRGSDDSGGVPDADTLWYRDAVIYQVHVRGFFDSNHDGVGDFPGLTSKLDYIQSLGVSAIWLQPFYPSPLRDDGYDIADYKGVHPQYGTRRDFLAFMSAARERGLRVITELVINHTSDQHPWFQAARRARRGSAKRDFYVWSDTDQRYAGVPIVFKDTERSNWTWDPVASQYYWHRFFHHQPDLNFDNPQVLKAVLKVMRFWLDMGVDGMRLDAVPYLVEREGTQCANLPETHAILRRIRAELDVRYRDRMLLAEANQWPSDVRAYFGDGDECHMAFHFPLMPRLFMALRQEDRHPLSEILYQMPDIPDRCQWAIFLRNHDELTLEMVSDEERDYMYQTYAADPEMRLNVGIRRRLAPLMENSRPRIELLTGLLLSLPGTPVLYYGDELGMGDNVYLGDRNGVRTPMQWNADRNGGFSRADPARLYAPPIMDSVYGYASVNVEAQERSSHSLLSWMRRTIALRQRHPTFGRGSMELLRPANRRIFAFIRRYGADDPILVVANLSRTVQPVTLHLGPLAGRVPVEMAGGVELPRITDEPYPLTLGPFAFYWLRLQHDAPLEAGRHRAAVPDAEPDASPLLVGPEWTQLLDGSVRQLLQRRYLPPFLDRQPWFVRRASPLARVEIVDWGTLRSGVEPVFLVVLDAVCADGETARYAVPLALADGAHADDVVRRTPDRVVAHIAGARQGVMHARVDGPAGDVLLQMLLDGRDVRLRRGVLRMRRLDAFVALALPSRVEDLPRRPRDLERFHSCAAFGEQIMLKVLRRLWPGPSPQMELGRFLSGTAMRAHVAEPLGAIEYDPGQGAAGAVVMIERFIPHQANGWQHAVDELQRVLDRAATQELPAIDPPPGTPLDATTVAAVSIGAYAQTAAKLGLRLGELHLVLASDDAVAEIADGQGDLVASADVVDRVAASCERARAALTAMTGPGVGLQSAVDGFVNQQGALGTAIHDARSRLPGALRLARIHGHLDLGHVLLYEGEVSFIGGADDVDASIAQRRALRSPIDDLASVLRSVRHVGVSVLTSRQSATLQERTKLELLARGWVAGVSAAVVGAYRAAVGDAAFVPREAQAVRALLWLLMIGQACDDVAASVAAQPVWLPVALAEVGELLGSGEASLPRWQPA